MAPHHTILPEANRRLFLQRSALGLGGIALAELLAQEAGAAPRPLPGVLAAPHLAAKAKRIIYLFMAGGPSQLDLFDPKPKLVEMNGQDLPDSVRQGQRLTGMSANQALLPLAGSVFKFARRGQSGATLSELLPWLAGVADRCSFVKSVYTEAINHDPAITFFQTGSQLAGRPSFGSWVSYGLGSANANLPGFVVLVSKDRTEQGLYSRLWGNGFLPSVHQGVQFRSGKDPVFYLDNPAGVSPASRRLMLDRFAELQHIQQERAGDAEIAARTAQYEMAYRMQTSVPEVMDLAQETTKTLELYGDDVKKPGTFAANCLLARRLAERDVRFIQLYHPGWDHHGGLPGGIKRQCRDIDRACYGLLTDLEQRGMLDDNPGRLRRRIRADELFAGEAHAGELRPRPPPALLHDVVRRRRHQAGNYPRLDRRVRLQRRRKARPRPRRAGDHSALPPASTTKN